MKSSLFFGAGCAVFLAACMHSSPHLAEASRPAPSTAAKPERSDRVDLKRVWTLEEWPGFPSEILHSAQTEMNLTALPHVSAHMGCNRMMFSAETTPHGHIFIGPVAATRMLCQGNMDLEMNFAAQIGSFTRYRLDGRKLILENEEGKKAVFSTRD